MQLQYDIVLPVSDTAAHRNGIKDDPDETKLSGLSRQAFRPILGGPLIMYCNAYYISYQVSTAVA